MAEGKLRVRRRLTSSQVSSGSQLPLATGRRVLLFLWGRWHFCSSGLVALPAIAHFARVYKGPSQSVVILRSGRLQCLAGEVALNFLWASVESWTFCFLLVGFAHSFHSPSALTMWVLSVGSDGISSCMFSPAVHNHFSSMPLPTPVLAPL